MNRKPTLLALTAIGAAAIGIAAFGDTETLFVDMGGMDSHTHPWMTGPSSIAVPLGEGAQITEIRFVAFFFATHSSYQSPDCWVSNVIIEANDGDIDGWHQRVADVPDACGAFGPFAGCPGCDADWVEEFPFGGPFTLTQDNLVVTVSNPEDWWEIFAGGIEVTYMPGDPVPPACPADLTGNGSVGVPDLLQLLACWGDAPGGSDCEASDLTGNGSVGVPDLLELLAQWGECPR